MSAPALVLIAALDRNRAIGRGNTLPWRLPDDLKRFKALTLGKPVLMGRKTAESLGRALPGRRNLVLTRQGIAPFEGMEAVNSIAAAEAIARADGADELCVIGGGEIYAQALPLADRLHVTHVLAKVDGDAHFPDIDPASWRIVRSQDFPAGEKDSHATRYTVYERSRPMTQVSP